MWTAWLVWTANTLISRGDHVPPLTEVGSDPWATFDAVKDGADGVVDVEDALRADSFKLRYTRLR